ncbi:MAG: hypothetical protein ACFFCG_04145, partial [Promethearchaeota archaeon]
MSKKIYQNPIKTINHKIYENIITITDNMNVNKVADNIYEIPQKALMARVEGKIEKFQMKVPV